MKANMIVNSGLPGKRDKQVYNCLFLFCVTVPPIFSAQNWAYSFNINVMVFT